MNESIIPMPYSDSELSFPQRGIWNHYVLMPENTTYNLYQCIEFHAQVNEETLRQACQKLVHMHEQLRSTFYSIHDTPVQRVYGEIGVSLHCINASGCNDQELDQMIKERYSIPFNLEKGPVIQFYLFVVSENKSLFLSVVHHIVFDGWSLLQALHDLAYYYNNPQVSCSLPDKTSYNTFKKWHKDFLNNDYGNQQLHYWLRTLGDEVGPIDLPYDYMHSSPLGTFSQEKSIELSNKKIAHFTTLFDSDKPTPFVILYTLVNVLLYCYSHNKSLILATPFLNRSKKEFRKCIGNFVNMVLIKTTISESSTIKDLIVQVQETLLHSQQNQNYPVSSILEHKKIPNRIATALQTQIHFNWVKIRTINSSLFTTPHTIHAIKQLGAPADIAFSVYDDNEKYRIEIRFRSDLFESATIDTLISDLQTLIDYGMVNYAHPVSTFPLFHKDLTNKISAQKRYLLNNSVKNSIDSENKIAPRTDIERILFVVWSEILGYDAFGMHDNFFQLGGNSLNATQVISRINALFANTFSISSLFQHPTIADFAHFIETVVDPHTLKQHIKPDVPSHSVSDCQESDCNAIFKTQSLHWIKEHHKPKQNSRDPDPSLAIPLSFSQERMWFINQLNPETSAYNIPFSLRITGLLNVSVLQQSFEELIKRHTILRTVFDVANGKPSQRILPHINSWFEFQDIAHLPIFDRQREAMAIAADRAQKRFDLSSGPLLRVCVIRCDHQDHVLLMCMHHSISDQWSMGIVLEEINYFYSRIMNNEPINLLPLPLQYSDFSQWQIKEYNETKLKQHVDYWKLAMHDYSGFELPLDRQRPTVQTSIGGYCDYEIPIDLVQKIRQISIEENATMYMVFLACFQILLQRYSGIDDIAVGSPIANRTKTEFEGLIGTFVNTLIMRTDLSGNPTFRSLVKKVRYTALKAFDHQDLPFEKLVEILQPHRDLSHLPLIQVLFNVINAPFTFQLYEDLEWHVFEYGETSAQFDLSMTIDTEYFYKVVLTYNKDLFDASTGAQLLRHFITIVKTIAYNPDIFLSDISLLSIEEQNTLVYSWNATTVAYDKSLSCIDLFMKQAATVPNNTAVVFNNTHMTYQELDRKTNQVCRYLQNSGFNQSHRIGIYLYPSLSLALALLAIQKLGAAYIPLDPDYPTDRIEYMLSDSNASAIITLSENSLSLNVSTYHSICLDLQESKIAELSDDPLIIPRPPDSLVYILYTSGSTGRPKGIMIPQKALTNFLLSMQKIPGITSHDILLSVTSISFDIFGLEFYLPLISGATVIFADKHIRSDGVELMNLLKQSKATMMQATPVTWRILLDAGWNGSEDFKILCGGEAFPVDIAQALLHKCTSIWNMYGPTETTIWSSVHRVTDSHPPIAIGKPIDNTTMYILDSLYRLVPQGVIGQLFIGGDGLALGYLNRPDITEKCFMNHPFLSGQKIYATGDKARFLKDGTLHCLGRIDTQVKIRGFRIELGEIESVLSIHGQVKQAIVIVWQKSSLNQHLIAYITLKTGTYDENLIQELKKLCKQKLPEYMIPSFFVHLIEVPLTPNGKIDKKLLPLPRLDLSSARQKTKEPRNETETKVAGIWKHVLSIDQVGIDDNFFSLGGHSLGATQIVSLTKETFGIDFTLRDFFMEPTVAGMANHITLTKQKDPTKQQTHAIAESELLFIMQPQGIRKPIFIVAGVHIEENGFYRYLSNLVPHIGIDQPLYGLRPKGLFTQSVLHTSVEEMASDFIIEMKKSQPHGPYYIGGECVGGIVAYEIAQQLLKNNEQIGLLFLLDTFYPHLQSNLQRRISTVTNKIRTLMEEINESPSPSISQIHSLVSTKLKRKMIFLRNKMNNTYSRENHLVSVESHYIHLTQQYIPKPIAEDVTLLVNSHDYASNPTLGWELILKNHLQVFTVPGNHLTRLTEYGEATGKRLRNCIDEAMKKEHTTELPKHNS